MGAAVKIRPGTFKHVENELFCYWETVKEVKRLRADIIHATPVRDSEGRGNLPGDPTGRTAVVLMTHRRLEQMERVVNAIRTVFDGLEPEKQRLIQLKYWTRPQTRTWEGIAQELHISRRQALRWRDQIVQDIAIHLGWW